MNCLKTTLGTLSGVPERSILQCSGNLTNLNPMEFYFDGCRPVCLFGPQGQESLIPYLSCSDGASDALHASPFLNSKTTMCTIPFEAVGSLHTLVCASVKVFVDIQ